MRAHDFSPTRPRCPARLIAVLAWGFQTREPLLPAVNAPIDHGRLLPDRFALRLCAVIGSSAHKRTALRRA